MIDLLSIVVGLTRVWTATYTLGLSPEAKEYRRSEIESDLWDQQRLACLQSELVRTTASHIFSRMLLGLPADIAWRAEAGASRRQESEVHMSETWVSRLGLFIAIGFALLPVAFGISVIAGNGDWGSMADRALWGGLWILMGIALVAGMLLVRRTYGRGLALVALAVVGFCITTFWMAFITVPVGIALLVLAHLRGRTLPVLQRPGTT